MAHYLMSVCFDDDYDIEFDSENDEANRHSHKRGPSDAQDAKRGTEALNSDTPTAPARRSTRLRRSNRWSGHHEHRHSRA